MPSSRRFILKSAGLTLTAAIFGHRVAIGQSNSATAIKMAQTDVLDIGYEENVPPKIHQHC